MIQHRQQGQSLVEFALLAILLLTFLFGVFDFGLAYYSQIAIKNAVAEGGYYAIHHPNDIVGVESAIDKELVNTSLIQKISIDVTACQPDSIGSQQTTIQATYRHRLIFSYLVPSMAVTLRAGTVVPQLGC